MRFAPFLLLVLCVVLLFFSCKDPVKESQPLDSIPKNDTTLPPRQEKEVNKDLKKAPKPLPKKSRTEEAIKKRKSGIDSLKPKTA